MHKDLHDSIKKYSSSTKTFNPCLSNYSVCLRNWPRAPGLRGEERDGNSRRAGSCHLGCWIGAFLFLPEYLASCSGFHAKAWVCVHSNLFYSFIVVRSACFVLSQYRKGGTHTLAFCSTHRILYTVAVVSWCLSTLEDSGVSSHLAPPKL